MKLSVLAKRILEIRDGEETSKSYVFSVDRVKDLQQMTDTISKYNFCKKMEKLADKWGSDPVSKWWANKADDIKNKNPGVIPSSGGTTPPPAKKSLNKISLNGKDVNIDSIKIEDIKSDESPHFPNAYIMYAKYADGTSLTYDEIKKLEEDYPDLVKTVIATKGLDKDPDQQWWWKKKDRR